MIIKNPFNFLILIIIGSAIIGSVSIAFHVSADRIMEDDDYNTIFIVPHTHFDPYWLDPWNVEVERWSTNVRNALDIMAVDPDMKFVLDQVVGIRYFWEHYPEYQNILKKYIAQGRVEIVQAFISQTELNLVGEMGLIADALWGIKWAEEVLGAEINVGWELDVFGFGAGTPTFYKKLGLENLIVCRTGIPINDGVFNWTGIDNSKIYGYKMPHYTHGFGDEGYLTTTRVQHINQFFEAMLKWIDYDYPPFQHTVNHDDLNDDRGDMMLFYGGDFSNPNIELSTWIKTWNALQAENTGYKLKIGTPIEFFDRLTPLLEQGGIVSTAVTPDRDLNPVFSGYYTSRVDFKKNIRFFEDKLQKLESFAAIAKQIIPNYTYPEDDFQRIWHKVATNHHHDSITGTSPQEVYEDNMQIFYQEIPSIQTLESNVFGTLAEEILLDSKWNNETMMPVVVYNSLGWNRTEPLLLNFSESDEYIPDEIVAFNDIEIIDPQTEIAIPSQIIQMDDYEVIGGKPANFQLGFIPESPGMGYKTYLLNYINGTQEESPTFLTGTIDIEGGGMNGNFSIENRYYRIDYNSSELEMPLQIYDKSLMWNLINNETINGTGWDLSEYSDLGDTYIYHFVDLPEKSSNISPKIIIKEEGPVRYHVVLSYEFSNSTYNRSIILYDEIPRVDFEETMYFYPNMSTSSTFQFNFDFRGADGQENDNEEIDFIYDGPFGKTIHNDDDTFFPALYDVTIKNATHAVSIINSGIHGYRRMNNSIEGVLIRFLNHTTPLDTEGSGVITTLDWGEYNFKYTITTFNATTDISPQFIEGSEYYDAPWLYPFTNDTGYESQQRLDYNFNFPLYGHPSTDVFGGTLSDTHQFFTINNTNVLLTGLKKNPFENSFSFQLHNLGSALENASIESEFFQNLDNVSAYEANFLSSKINGNSWNKSSAQPSMMIEMDINPYSWETIVYENENRDINGPKVENITFHSIRYNDFVKFEVEISDRELSNISSARLEFCYNETFEGQVWEQVKMEFDSKAGAVYTFIGQINKTDTIQRPLYVRVIAYDDSGNVGISQVWLVIDEAHINSAELFFGILLTSIIGIVIIILVRKSYPSKELPKGTRKLGIIISFKSESLNKFLKRLGPKENNDYRIKLLVPLFTYGLIYFTWLLIKGYFGLPVIERMNNGYEKPGQGVFFGWDHYPWNNIYDFFVPNLWIITFGFSILVFFLIYGVFKQKIVIWDLLIYWVVILMIPLIAYLFYPIIFIIGDAPGLYWSQMINIWGFYNGIHAMRMRFWFYIPIILGGVFITLLIEIPKWIKGELNNRKEENIEVTETDVKNKDVSEESDQK